MSPSPIIKVLVVEDNPGDVRLLREMLAKAREIQKDVQYFDQLTPALKRLREEDIDVVLLDLSLPDSVGFDTFDRVRQEAPQVPVVILSGLDDEVLAMRTVQGGAQDYLVKGETSGNLLVRAIRYAVERKRTEETLKRRAKQLALINHVGRKIAATLELDSVLNRAASLVQESFGYHHVAVFTVDRERGELVMKTCAGDFADLFPRDHRLQLGQGMVGTVGESGEKLLANDVETDPRYVNLYPDVVPTRSELSVPMRVGEKTVGVLDIQSPQINAFDDDDVMVMETLADQIAVAIENARLYDALQRKAAAVLSTKRPDDAQASKAE